MKNMFFIAAIVMAASSLLAQPREGKYKEMSLSGSYQNYSSGSSSGSSGAFLISPRVGFYVHEGLELEPELLLMFASGSDPVYVLNGNVSYNFLSVGKGIPFLLVGYGLANTVPIFNVPIGKTGFTVGVLNVGGGVKAFLHEDIAIRIEYRYQNFSGEGEKLNFGGFSYTQKTDISIHTAQFGLSVLL